jgi:hypothetical protein
MNEGNTLPTAAGGEPAPAAGAVAGTGGAAAGGAVDRLLGPTAGPYAGRVRALLMFAFVAGYLALLAYFSVMWLSYGRDGAKDFVLTGWGLLGSAVSYVVGHYLGNRKADGA